MTLGRAALAGWGFLLMVAYWPFITGAATTPRWSVLVIGLVSLLWLPPLRVNAVHLTGAAFLGWCCLTFLWTSSPLDSVDALAKLLVLAGLFVVGASLRDLRPLYLGAAAGLAVSSGLVLLDIAGAVSYAQASRPAGLFLNYLYLAEVAALVLVACVDLGAWWAAAAVAPSIGIVYAARGPILALWVAAGAGLGRRWGGFAAVGGLGLIAAILMRPSSVLERFALWLDVLPAWSFAGHGWGSYYGAAPAFMSHIDVAAIRHPHPNNLPLELLFEVGLIGLALAVALYILLLLAAPRTERLVLIAFLVEACLGFPLSLPATAGLIAVVAGHAARHHIPVDRLPLGR